MCLYSHSEKCPEQELFLQSYFCYCCSNMTKEKILRLFIYLARDSYFLLEHTGSGTLRVIQDSSLNGHQKAPSVGYPFTHTFVQGVVLFIQLPMSLGTIEVHPCWSKCGKKTLMNIQVFIV